MSIVGDGEVRSMRRKQCQHVRGMAAVYPEEMAGGIVFRFGACMKLETSQVESIAFGEKVDLVGKHMVGQCGVLDPERCVSAKIGDGVFWIEADRGGLVGNCGGVVALARIGQAETGVGGGAARVELDRFALVLNCAVVVGLGQVGIATVGVRRSVARVELDCLTLVGDLAVVIAPGAVCRATIGIGIGILRGEPDRCCLVNYLVGVIALFAVDKATQIVGIDIFRSPWRRRQ